MIRIHKSSAIPAVLIDKGIPATAKNCQLYLANFADYDAGTAKFNIDSDVYGDPFVKRQLTLEQHDKCCFCEADLPPMAMEMLSIFDQKLVLKQLLLVNSFGPATTG